MGASSGDMGLMGRKGGNCVVTRRGLRWQRCPPGAPDRDVPARPGSDRHRPEAAAAPMLLGL